MLKPSFLNKLFFFKNIFLYKNLQNECFVFVGMGFGGFEFLPTIPPLSEESKAGKQNYLKKLLKNKMVPRLSI